MKIRNGFVSNSSSSSFIITNKSSDDLSLVDFVLENPQLVEEFIDQYSWNADDYNYTQMGLCKSAEEVNIIFPADSSNEYIFGDEDGTIVGEVLDYILRDGGESENFSWKFHTSHR